MSRTPTTRKTTADLPTIEGPLGGLIQSLSNLLFGNRALMLGIFAALTVARTRCMRRRS